MSEIHLTFEGTGASIAKIKGTNHIISLSSDAKHSADELKLEKDESFSPMPNTSKERDVLYIFGQSGSGKSFYVYLYAQNYKKIYPKNSIYVFSTLDSDKEGLDKMTDAAAQRDKQIKSIGKQLTWQKVQNTAFKVIVVGVAAVIIKNSIK